MKKGREEQKEEIEVLKERTKEKKGKGTKRKGRK